MCSLFLTKKLCGTQLLKKVSHQDDKFGNIKVKEWILDMDQISSLTLTGLFLFDPFAHHSWNPV
jgi:hypothetical protein